ncbi:MAG TPA: SpoIIE family protein phosphatase [Abditibacteriaceae bacterium]|jgi:serine phosphatase RsbU (regulator of sigma subunit)
MLSSDASSDIEESDDWERAVKPEYFNWANLDLRQLRQICLTESDDLRWLSQGQHQQTAREIQQRLLPNRLPDVPGFSLRAHSSPAAEVGGDYYNIHWVSGHHLGILIADVSGKGMAAAHVATALASVFRIQTWGNHNVVDVLGRVNDFVRHALRPGVFITCSYGILDIPARRWTWARAGHEPLALGHRDGSVNWRVPSGAALGVFNSRELMKLLEVDSVQLKSGDELFLFTDGLTEAMNDSSEELGLARIGAAVSDHVRLNAIEASSISERIARAVRRHTRGSLPHDDLTFFSIACQ